MSRYLYLNESQSIKWQVPCDTIMTYPPVDELQYSTCTLVQYDVLVATVATSTEYVLWYLHVVLE
jgi:hypothetical protein